MDADDRWVKARAAYALAKKHLGFRSTFSVVPLDPAAVRGSHGRLPTAPADAPIVLCSEDLGQDAYAATEVRSLLLRIIGAHP